MPLKDYNVYIYICVCVCVCEGGDWAKMNNRYFTKESETTQCNPSCTHERNYHHQQHQQKLTYGLVLVNQTWTITPTSAARLSDGLLAASSTYPRIPVTETSVFASPSRPKGWPSWGQMRDHTRPLSSYPIRETYSVNRQNNRVESSPRTILWKGGKEGKRIKNHFEKKIRGRLLISKQAADHRCYSCRHRLLSYIHATKYKYKYVPARRIPAISLSASV